LSGLASIGVYAVLHQDLKPSLFITPADCLEPAMNRRNSCVHPTRLAVTARQRNREGMTIATGCRVRPGPRPQVMRTWAPVENLRAQEELKCSASLNPQP
jgi:hypothetical protein